VKTAHVHPARCNLEHWHIRDGSPTIHLCLMWPQVLYRWQHQSRILWMYSRTNENLFLPSMHVPYMGQKYHPHSQFDSSLNSWSSRNLTIYVMNISKPNNLVWNKNECKQYNSLMTGITKFHENLLMKRDVCE
jgi:hypothetical protein